jgi:acetoin utilization deacetylase AcuC-like enzyme
MMATTDSQFLLLQRVIPGINRNQKPDFIFYLAGVDILASDKLG